MNTTTEKTTVEEAENDDYEPELGRPQEDCWESRGSPRANRLRSGPYKTRGSVVQKLHHDKEQSAEYRSRQSAQLRKPKVHLPRTKNKPRLDVYIPTTVTVGTLARILDVKFGTSLCFSPIIRGSDVQL